MKQLKVFLGGLLAGISIAIGGTVFLSLDNKVLGALFFTVGLFAVCTFGFNLFTGKVCYVFEQDRAYALNLPLIWLGNLAGCGLTALAESATRVGPALSEKAQALCAVKLNDSPVSIFILAFFFYIDGVHTVISMATSYGAQVGIEGTQLVLALLVTQFVAFPSAILYGKLAGKFGTLRMIRVAVAAYVVIVIFAAFFLKSAVEFWVLAIAVGLFQGGVQALSRSYFGKIIPKEKSNECYGFFDIFGKYASVMGTALVSGVAFATGNESLGVLSIGILLVIGFLLLMMLPKDQVAA
jgi:MFS-type transporter involved in bile tolerance (Atg22 family)